MKSFLALASLLLLLPTAAAAWSFGWTPFSSPLAPDWQSPPWALPAQILLPTEIALPNTSPDVQLTLSDPPTGLVFAGHLYAAYDVTAVPEPSTGLLLCLGLVGLAAAPGRGWSSKGS